MPIVRKRVGTPFPGDLSDALNRNFEYDPLYRVIYGNGRESDTQSGNSYLYADAPAPGTPNANNVRAYERNYAYDKMGNVKSVVQSGSNGFTRAFTYNTGKNTLQKVENATPSLIEDFAYDACGNQTLAGTNRHYVWDHANRLLSYYNQAGGGDPSVFTQYDYSGHDRISKLVRTGTAGSPIYERTIYIDGIFEYHILENGTTYEKNYVHIMDNRSRIAEIRLGTPFPGDIGDAVVYNLEDQIGSSVTRLNTSGAVIDKEEYYPFGDSSLRTFSSKRYRYVGKEKDSESGLYYYGARYYAAWTCRFISVDPLAGKYNYWSSYVHARNNPIMFVDINGEGPDGGGGTSASLEGPGSSSDTTSNNPNITIIVNAGEAPVKPDAPDNNLDLLREAFENDKTTSNYLNLIKAEKQWDNYNDDLAKYDEDFQEYQANSAYLENIKTEIETSSDPVLSLQREELKGKTITLEINDYITNRKGERLGAATKTNLNNGAITLQFDRKYIESGIDTEVTRELSRLPPNYKVAVDLLGMIVHELGHVISNKDIPLTELDYENHDPKSELDSQRWEAFYYRIKHDLTLNFHKSNKDFQHLNISIIEYEKFKKGF